jgi:hypothetical protein
MVAHVRGKAADLQVRVTVAHRVSAARGATVAHVFLGATRARARAPFAKECADREAG